MIATDGWQRVACATSRISSSRDERGREWSAPNCRETAVNPVGFGGLGETRRRGDARLVKRPSSPGIANSSGVSATANRSIINTSYGELGGSGRPTSYYYLRTILGWKGRNLVPKLLGNLRQSLAIERLRNLAQIVRVEPLHQGRH